MLFMLSALFEVETDSTSCKGMWPLDLPISSTRKLWQAQSEEQFQKVYRDQMSHEHGSYSTTYHEVMGLEQGDQEYSVAHRLLLEDQLMQLDDFGLLAITTAKYAYDHTPISGVGDYRQAQLAAV